MCFLRRFTIHVVLILLQKAGIKICEIGQAYTFFMRLVKMFAALLLGSGTQLANAEHVPALGGARRLV